MPTSDEGPAKAPAVRHEVEGPRMTDALYEPFKNEPTPIGVDPADGLPRPIVSQAWEDAQAPELDPHRFVCMADCSAFVIRDEWGDPIVRLDPSEVERAPDGRWRIKSETLAPKLQERIEAARTRRRQRRRSGATGPRREFPGGPQLSEPSDSELCELIVGGHDGYCLVEPLRPQCHHYARQLVPFPEEKTRTLALRLCTARRTDEGEFLDVGNAQILACELRSPVYGNEVAQIDAFDARTIEHQQKSRANEVADDFDLDAALGAEDTTTKGN